MEARGKEAQNMWEDGGVSQSIHKGEKHFPSQPGLNVC